MFWTNFTIDVLLVLFVLDCAFMCLVIMMQRSKQEGLGAAFGGGFTESVWGAQTSQVLVKATVWCAALFFIISISLARLYSHRSALEEQSGGHIQQELMKPVAPAISAPIPATPTTNAPAAAMAPTTNAPVTVPVTNAPTVPDKPAAK
jgi:preprotein translocase subunit SecG